MPSSLSYIITGKAKIRQENKRTNTVEKRKEGKVKKQTFKLKAKIKDVGLPEHI